jgi:hypothetical protein
MGALMIQIISAFMTSSVLVVGANRTTGFVSRHAHGYLDLLRYPGTSRVQISNLTCISCGSFLRPDGFPVAPFRVRRCLPPLRRSPRLSVRAPAADVRSCYSRTFRMRSWFVGRGLMDKDDLREDHTCRAAGRTQLARMLLMPYLLSLTLAGSFLSPQLHAILKVACGGQPRTRGTRLYGNLQVTARSRSTAINQLASLRVQCALLSFLALLLGATAVKVRPGTPPPVPCSQLSIGLHAA